MEYMGDGAQGSVQVNGMVADILPWLLEQANVLHLCGRSRAGRLADAVLTAAGQ